MARVGCRGVARGLLCCGAGAGEAEKAGAVEGTAAVAAGGGGRECIMCEVWGRRSFGLVKEDMEEDREERDEKLDEYDDADDDDAMLESSWAEETRRRRPRRVRNRGAVAGERLGSGRAIWLVLTL